MADTPSSLNFWTTSRVRVGVVLGVMLTGRPISRPYAIRSKRSGRFIGSPPVRMIMLPIPFTSRIKNRPSSVVSSCGSRCGIAEARQCTHSRSQAMVISQ